MRAAKLACIENTPQLDPGQNGTALIRAPPRPVFVRSDCPRRSSRPARALRVRGRSRPRLILRDMTPPTQRCCCKVLRRQNCTSRRDNKARGREMASKKMARGRCHHTSKYPATIASTFWPFAQSPAVRRKRHMTDRQTTLGQYYQCYQCSSWMFRRRGSCVTYYLLAVFRAALLDCEVAQQ